MKEVGFMMVEVHDARQIRAIRAALSLSLTEMGERAGVHRNTVHALERCFDIKRHRLAAMAIANVASEHGIICGMEDGHPVLTFAG